MKKILVPVSLDRTSGNALMYAFKLFPNSELIVFHVQMDLIDPLMDIPLNDQVGRN